MRNKKIIRRTYTKHYGQECDKVMYASSPKSMMGWECFDKDIDNAYLFNSVNEYFPECTINGNDRNGDFQYKQEIIEVELNLKRKKS